MSSVRTGSADAEEFDEVDNFFDEKFIEEWNLSDTVEEVGVVSFTVEEKSGGIADMQKVRPTGESIRELIVRVGNVKGLGLNLWKF